jgi:hypothetical protein
MDRIQIYRKTVDKEAQQVRCAQANIALFYPKIVLDGVGVKSCNSGYYGIVSLIVTGKIYLSTKDKTVFCR